MICSLYRRSVRQIVKSGVQRRLHKGWHHATHPSKSNRDTHVQPDAATHCSTHDADVGSSEHRHIYTGCEDRVGSGSSLYGSDASAEASQGSSDEYGLGTERYAINSIDWHRLRRYGTVLSSDVSNRRGCADCARISIERLSIAWYRRSPSQVQLARPQVHPPTRYRIERRNYRDRSSVPRLYRPLRSA